MPRSARDDIGSQPERKRDMIASSNISFKPDYVLQEIRLLSCGTGHDVSVHWRQTTTGSSFRLVLSRAQAEELKNKLDTALCALWFEEHPERIGSAHQAGPDGEPEPVK